MSISVLDMPRSGIDGSYGGGSEVKTSAPGEGNGNPLQYSCLENPMDAEAW